MKGRERKIPVQVYNEDDDSTFKNESNNFGYIENREEQVVDEILEKGKSEKPAPQEKLPERTEPKNIMQGLIEHQKEYRAETINKKDKKHLILWFGVSVFALIVIIVWGMSLRFNINQVNDELQKDEDINAINSISEKFINSFEFIKGNINDFEDLKESLETENTKNETISQLKNKIEKDNIEEKQLPKVEN